MSQRVRRHAPPWQHLRDELRHHLADGGTREERTLAFAGEHLLVRRPDIAVLYTSGYAEDVVVHQGVADSDVAFIAKPYTGAALAERVRALLDARAGARNRG